VRQQPPYRELAVPGQVKVPADRVVEVEQPVVAALHDQYRGERLRHRPEPEPGVRPDPDLVCPQWTVGAVQCDGQRRDAPVRLGALREPRVAEQRVGH